MKCNHCVNMGKSSSHRTYSYVRGVRTLTCPELKITECQRCGLKGHTERYCKVEFREKKKVVPSPSVNKVEILKSKYASLFSSDEESSEEDLPKKKSLSWSPKNEMKRYTPVEDSSSNIQEEITTSPMVDLSVISHAKFSGVQITRDGSIPWGTTGTRVFKVFQSPDYEQEFPQLSDREIMGLHPLEERAIEAEERKGDVVPFVPKFYKPPPKEMTKWSDFDDYDSDEEVQDPTETTDEDFRRAMLF